MDAGIPLLIDACRGVNFGADNWLVFKKVTVDQVTTGQTDSTSVDLNTKEEREEKEAIAAVAVSFLTSCD